MPESGEEQGFVERLAERIGGRATARSVFGDPVERDDVTVIPVAKSTWGFGGGSGGDGAQQGAGGGGGGVVTPLGYIEVRSTGAEFKPVRDPRLSVLLAGAAFAITVLILRRLGR